MMKNILMMITIFTTALFLSGCGLFNVVTNEGLLLAKKVVGVYEANVDTSSLPFSGETPVRITIAQSNNDENPQIAVLIEGEIEGESKAVCTITSDVSQFGHNIVGSRASYGESLGNIKGTENLSVRELEDGAVATVELEQLGVNDQVQLSEEQRIGTAPLFFNLFVDKCTSLADDVDDDADEATDDEATDDEETVAEAPADEEIV